MKLQVVRTQFGKDATNGMLFIDGVFECFTLEDQEQAVNPLRNCYTARYIQRSATSSRKI